MERKCSNVIAITLLEKLLSKLNHFWKMLLTFFAFYWLYYRPWLQSYGHPDYHNCVCISSALGLVLVLSEGVGGLTPSGASQPPVFIDPHCHWLSQKYIADPLWFYHKSSTAWDFAAVIINTEMDHKLQKTLFVWFNAIFGCTLSLKDLTNCVNTFGPCQCIPTIFGHQAGDAQNSPARLFPWVTSHTD